MNHLYRSCTSLLTISRPLENVRYMRIKWFRKPMALGTCKSKLYREYKRPVVPTNEYLEMKRLHNNYNTYIRSITAFFVRRQVAASKITLDLVQIQKDMDADFEQCKAINDEWNEEQRLSREIRLEEKLKQDLLEADRRMEEYMLEMEKEAAERTALVEQEIEKSKTYITPTTLVQAIEHALKNPVDHNFAINLAGEEFREYPKPSALKLKLLD